MLGKIMCRSWMKVKFGERFGESLSERLVERFVERLGEKSGNMLSQPNHNLNLIQLKCS
jgi:hypothetical protein